MAGPLVILVFLASGGRPDPVGSAMTLAARQALGREAVVLVDERQNFPTDGDARSLGERAHAAAVVEVVWRDPLHTQVSVRVHEEHHEPWRERDIEFRPGDPPDECGRTIGFAMASLLEREEAAETPDTSSPASPAEQALREGERPPAPVPAQSFRWMVEAVGLGTVGGGPGTTTGGGELAGFVSIVPRVSALATANVRVGDIGAAQSNLSSFEFGGGAALRTFVSARLSFEADLRAEAFATFLVVRHQRDSQSSWLPGARVAVEGAWFPLVPSVGIVTLVGAEAAFGNAYIVVGDHTVATVPPFRAIGELGLRARF